MKKIIIYFAALAATAVSCSKDIAPEQITPEQTTQENALRRGNLTIRFDTPQTKAALTEDESRINDVFVCIFNNDSKTLDVQPVKLTSYDKEKGITIDNVAYGSKTVAVAINCGQKTPSSESFETFIASTSDLKDNSRTNLVMVGYNKDFNVSADQNTVNIKVKRLVAKVTVADVKYDFSSSNIVVPSIKLTGVYIGNCGAIVDMEGNYKSGMYNKYTPSEPIALDSAVEGICACSLDLTVSSSYQNINKTLYTYANTGDKEDSRPYIVIGCQYNNSQRYYRYPLPAIQANKVYEIQHIILSHAPDSGNLKVEITLGNWDEPEEDWLNNGTIQL